MSAGPPAGVLVDSHCHLQLLDEGERQEALDAARARGVGGFLVPSIELADAEDVLELCHAHDDVWCAIGVHPHSASSWQPGDAERLAGLLADPRAVAVGECGLDFFYDNSPREQQVRALIEQWQVACDLDLPVVVHNRDSDRQMLEVVRRPELAGLRADFHSFAAGREMASELVERGFFLGISGMVTFPRADNVREVLALAPDRLLVETDTPYLAPVPYRGRPNRPAYVVEVAERVAAELGETLEVFTARSTASFRRLFFPEREASLAR